MKENLVSVIMPTYNCGKFIEETIKSVANQTYKNWELIIVDDCSKDNTEVTDIEYILRGYENLDKKLNKLGANIQIEEGD